MKKKLPEGLRLDQKRTNLLVIKERIEILCETHEKPLLTIQGIMETFDELLKDLPTITILSDVALWFKQYPFINVRENDIGFVISYKQEPIEWNQAIEVAKLDVKVGVESAITRLGELGYNTNSYYKEMNQEHEDFDKDNLLARDNLYRFLGIGVIMKHAYEVVD